MSYDLNTQTPEELLSALRQFRHNNSDEFVTGYDTKVVNREFAAIEKKMHVKVGSLNQINVKLDNLMDDKKLFSVLRLIQSDPHQWSSRGCQTCQAITDLSGQDFGCNLYRKQDK